MDKALGTEESVVRGPLSVANKAWGIGAEDRGRRVTRH